MPTQGRGIGSSGTGLTDVQELPCVRAGTRTLVLFNNRTTLVTEPSHQFCGGQEEEGQLAIARPSRDRPEDRVREVTCSCNPSLQNSNLLELAVLLNKRNPSFLVEFIFPQFYYVSHWLERKALNSKCIPVNIPLINFIS